MITIEECKKYIGALGLSNKEIEDIRDALCVIAENVLDSYMPCGILPVKDEAAKAEKDKQ